MDCLTGGRGVTRGGSCLTTDCIACSLLYWVLTAGAVVTGVQSSCSWSPGSGVELLVVTGELVGGSNVDRA